MKIALIGNPNAGKTSIFNALTGLNQHVGNFAGVTVEKHIGTLKIKDKTLEIIDLPGTYSLYPKSLDEQVVLDVLLDKTSPDYPDAVLVVADASNIKRNLLLFTQIQDLGFPTLLALNMSDIAEKAGIKYDLDALQADFQTKIIFTNARIKEGINALLEELSNLPDVYVDKKLVAVTPFAKPDSLSKELLDTVKKDFLLVDGDNYSSDYLALMYLHHYEKLNFISEENKIKLQKLSIHYAFSSPKMQSAETLERYEKIDKIISKSTKKDEKNKNAVDLSLKIDKVLLHPVGGYLIFFGVLFLIFQAVFALAEYPMNAIEEGTSIVTRFFKGILPESILTDLFTDGIIAGIGGVIIFIPQIAILFTFIAILEESGYMTRVMMMMDKVMRKFGLNGRSVVPLVSGMACAIPAIMATRSIDNYKERLLTILVTPLVSCSARIPVYTIIIALVIPDEKIWGFLGLQGLVMMGLYLLGFIMALLGAIVMQIFIKTTQKSYFIMEMPTYKMPRWKNVSITIVEKVRAFVWEAGRMIVAISIVLWALASFAPGNSAEIAEKETRLKFTNLPEKELEMKVNSAKLEVSYAGHLGKFIEPAIAPLGYDWKIGIALITSFAAREVFVGTMATIYSIGEEDDTTKLREKMAMQRKPDGTPVYTLASGVSLLLFYAFAMQCMSTIAVVKRETKGWKYPIIQLIYLTVLAYLMAFLAFWALS